jgi:hypothetical protein
MLNTEMKERTRGLMAKPVPSTFYFIILSSLFDIRYSTFISGNHFHDTGSNQFNRMESIRLGNRSRGSRFWLLRGLGLWIIVIFHFG